MRHDAETIKEIFLAAAEIASHAERDAFLRQACVDDRSLRDRIDALLRVHNRPDSLLDHPIFDRPDTSASTDIETPNQNADLDSHLDFLKPSDKPGSLGRLSHFEALEVLGRGGMGIVLRAFDEKLHRTVAIKVLAPHLAFKETARRRFVREARAAAAVNHDNVISIYDVEDDAPTPFLVMQCIDGDTLQDKLDRGPMAPSEIVRIGHQIAAGLAAAHRQGLVHRDIKPANILLEHGSDRVKITDFGLARSVDDTALTQSGYIAGTPMYMSPEQARSERADHRTDLFSLGSVLYALCTGQPPFRADNSMAVLKKVCEETQRPVREINPAVPSWLESVISLLLAKQPESRIQTASEVATLLGRRMLQLRNGHDLSPSELKEAFETEKKWLALGLQPNRRRWLSIAAFGGAAVSGALGAWLLGKNLRTQANGIDTRVQTEIPASAPTLPIVIKQARVLNRHTRGVLSLAFSPDGRILASGSQDEGILFWDTKSWEARGPLEGHKGDVYGLAFSPDGQRLASVSTANEDCAIRLWDVATGKPAGSLGGSGRGSFGVAFSPDGKSIACGGWGKELRVWNTSDWKQRLAIPNVVTQHIRALAFSSDSRWIATGGSGPTRIWNAETGAEIVTGARLPLDLCPSFLPGDKSLVGWHFREGRIVICNLPDGRVTAAWKAHPRSIEGLAVSRDGRFLASVGTEGVARIWSTADQVEVATLIGHRDIAYAASFSADGALLATAGKDDLTVRIWELPLICRTQD